MPCANRHMQMQRAVVPARRCAARRGQRPKPIDTSSHEYDHHAQHPQLQQAGPQSSEAAMSCPPCNCKRASHGTQ